MQSSIIRRCEFTVEKRRYRAFYITDPKGGGLVVTYGHERPTPPSSNSRHLTSSSSLTPTLLPPQISPRTPLTTRPEVIRVLCVPSRSPTPSRPGSAFEPD